MNKRLIVALAIGLAVLYMGLAATADTLPKAAQIGPQAEATIPAPDDALKVTLTQGPDPFCAGWHLYYTLVMTNTMPSGAFTGVVVTDRVPSGTWVHVPELGGAIPGVYDADEGVITWTVGQIDAGQVTRLNLLLRTYSGQPSGKIITNTFVYSATELAQVGQVSDGATIDLNVCGATPTPTSTPTITPTSTPTKPVGWAVIPLVTR